MHQPKLRGAIIGCGFFGRIQWDAWQRMPDVEMVAACDGMLDRAASFSPAAFTDAAAMLRAHQLDFVDIATRPASHLELVQLSVAAGIPCICQKPIAETVEQAAEMERIAVHAGVRVMVHENWRWQPWYREVKRRILAGAIGQPITYQFRIRQRDGLGDRPYPNQPYFAEMPRLLVYETLIHPIDTARFLFGDIAAVSARLRRYNPRIAGEDRAILTLTHTNGTDGIIDGHRFLNPDPPGPAMGDARFEGEDGTLQVLANGEIHCAGACVWRYNGPDGYKGDSVLATQRHFVDCLRQGTPFETGLAEYAQSFRAVDAAYRSATEARAVSLA